MYIYIYIYIMCNGETSSQMNVAPLQRCQDPRGNPMPRTRQQLRRDAYVTSDGLCRFDVLRHDASNVAIQSKINGSQILGTTVFKERVWVRWLTKQGMHEDL